MQTLATRLRRGQRKHKQVYSNQELLDKLTEVAKREGRTPGVKTFRSYVGSSMPQLLILRFGSWAEACEAAGLKPNPRPRSSHSGFGQRLYTDQEVEATYRRLAELLGQPPSFKAWNVYREDGDIGADAIRKRYRSWTNFLIRMERL